MKVSQAGIAATAAGLELNLIRGELVGARYFVPILFFSLALNSFVYNDRVAGCGGGSLLCGPHAKLLLW